VPRPRPRRGAAVAGARRRHRAPPGHGAARRRPLPGEHPPRAPALGPHPGPALLRRG
jgi:hypothetical protein